jgi:hypothetical protein
MAGQSKVILTGNFSWPKSQSRALILKDIANYFTQKLEILQTFSSQSKHRKNFNLPTARLIEMIVMS